MSISRFLSALHSGRALLMDGAMGTELHRAGLNADECGEAWNLTHPERVRKIHQAYVNAGAEVLLTNTFLANPATLETRGQRTNLGAIYQAAQQLARSAAGNDRFVLLDLGPVVGDDSLGTIGRMDWLKELPPFAATSDGLLLETCSAHTEALLVKQLRDSLPWLQTVPILLSLTYLRDPQRGIVTRHGQRPKDHAKSAQADGVAAFGVNCGRDIGMTEIIEIIRGYREATDLPLFARPNAGTPQRVSDQWVYPHSTRDMATRLPELLDAGVSMVGGCCGTTPEYIAAFCPIIEEWNARHGNANA